MPNESPTNADFIKSLIYGDDKPIGRPEEGESSQGRQEEDTIENTAALPAPASPEGEPASPRGYWEELAKMSDNQITGQAELRALLEKNKKYADLETQHAALKEEYRQALETRPVFASEYIEKLNALELQGDKEKVKLFEKLHAIGELKDMDSLQAVKTMLQWKHGLSSEEAQIMINKDYKLDQDIYSQEEIDQNKVALKIAGDQAKKYLEELKASTQVNPVQNAPTKQPDQAELEKLYQAREQELSPTVKSIEQSLPDFFKKVNVNGLKEEKAKFYDLPVPADTREKVANALKHFAIEYQVDHTNAEHLKALAEFAKSSAKAMLYDAHLIEVRKRTEEEIRAEFHNPSNIDRGADNPDRPEKTKQQKVIDSLLSD